MVLEGKEIEIDDRVYDTELGGGTVFTSHRWGIRVRFDIIENHNYGHRGWQYNTEGKRARYGPNAFIVYESKRTLFIKPEHSCLGLIVCKECMKDAVDF